MIGSKKKQAKADDEKMFAPAPTGVQLEKPKTFVLYKGKKSKPATIARAIRSLTMVLRVGESEARALEIVGHQFHKFEIGRAFEHAAVNMREEGASFKQALLAEEIIPRTARELIEASPTSQSLHKNLQQAAVLVAESQSIKKKLLTSLIQPGFMMGLCIAFLFASAAFIIPGFIKVFEDMGTETPPLTLTVLRIAGVTKWVIGSIIAALLLYLAFWFIYGRRSEKVRAAMDTLFIKTPAIGSILQLSAASRLFQLLAANLATGIGEPDSLRSAANGCGNEALKVFCTQHAVRMIQEGVPLKGFVETKLMPDDARQIISSAPSIRQEIEIMNELAPEYRDEANQQLTTLSATLEPIINYAVYAVAGALIISIMLPMYSIYPALMNMG